jgi:hypothetical protein
VILALESIAALGAKLIVVETWYWFQIVADIRDFFCWVSIFPSFSA